LIGRWLLLIILDTRQQPAAVVSLQTQARPLLAWFIGWAHKEWQKTTIDKVQ